MMNSQQLLNLINKESRESVCIPSELAIDLAGISGLDNETLTELLDEIVHTLSETRAIKENPHDQHESLDEYESYLDTASMSASMINNQGIEAQLAYILSLQGNK